MLKSHIKLTNTFKKRKTTKYIKEIYDAPNADLSTTSTIENNSGMKEDTFPDGVKGWSWGGFLLNWIWAIGNKTWIGLLAFVPYIGLIVSIYLGIKGRELAWKNKKWDSLEHFNQVQRSWTKWSLIVIVGALVIGILAAVFLSSNEY